MKTMTFGTFTDEQLIEQYLAGNSNALSQLYNKYYSKVYHKCLSFTRNNNDAFDLSQDVLMKAFSKISSFKGNSKFSTWLFAITNNYCISAVSKSKSVIFDGELCEYSLEDDSMSDEEFELRLARENMELRLKDVINEIPELDRELLDLKYMHKYSVKELQELYNLSASAVKMRLMRARQKVERCFYQSAV